MSKSTGFSRANDRIWLKAGWRADIALEGIMDKREKYNLIELGKRICSVYDGEKIPKSFFITYDMPLPVNDICIKKGRIPGLSLTLPSTEDLYINIWIYKFMKEYPLGLAQPGWYWLSAVASPSFFYCLLRWTSVPLSSPASWSA